MFSRENFAIWLGLGRDPIPATPATGVLRVDKTGSLIGKSLTIPKDHEFIHPDGFKFEVIDAITLSESHNYTGVAVVADTPGEAFNVSPETGWSTGITNLTAENRQAFTGGAEAIAGRTGLYPQRQKGLGPSNEALDMSLEVGQELCRDIVGYEDVSDLPTDDRRVQFAVFLVALYYLENNLIQEKDFTVPTMASSSPRQTSYFRWRTHGPLMQQVCGLLSHLTKFDLHITGVASETA